MPRLRDPDRDGLRPGLLYFLVRGEMPAQGTGAGRIEAFELRHGIDPVVVRNELRRLWLNHSDEIRAATPAGTDPWILEALRSRDVADEQEEPREEDKTQHPL